MTNITIPRQSGFNLVPASVIRMVRTQWTGKSPPKRPIGSHVRMVTVTYAGSNTHIAYLQQERINQDNSILPSLCALVSGVHIFTWYENEAWYKRIHKFQRSLYKLHGFNVAAIPAVDPTKKSKATTSNNLVVTKFDSQSFHPLFEFSSGTGRYALKMVNSRVEVTFSWFFNRGALTTISSCLFIDAYKD